jgi:hypothetical protein
MDQITALYRKFDPEHPLEASEEELYVDWQRELGGANIKQMLARNIMRSGSIAVSRLFTGHRGVGKTTELKRVKQILESQGYFVSMLEAEQWLELNDVAPPDIVFQIVRQLVTDLDSAGFGFAGTRFKQFFKEAWEIANQPVELKDVKVKAGPVELGAAVKADPVARSQLRELMKGQLTNVYELINKVILAEAKNWLKEPAHGGFDDVLVIVDELDRIPQKILNEQGLTNHENIFLDHAGVLRFLDCTVLYTVPIELAYSHRREALRQAYSSDILTLPVLPVVRKDGHDSKAGLKALCEIVERRAQEAGIDAGQMFEDRALLERLCRLSGGHLRNLFLFIRSTIDRSDDLPLARPAVEQTIADQANSLGLPLGNREKAALRQVHDTKTPVEDDPGGIWYGLLRDLYVFAYTDDTGLWYDWNPLLAEVL